MQNTSNGMSTAALVLSIAGLLTMCCGGSVVLGSLAILFALLSRGTEPMNGQAKAAIGISIAGVVLGIAAIIGSFVYVFTNPEANSIYRDYMQYYYDEFGDTDPNDDYNFDEDFDEDDLLRYYEDYFNEDHGGDGYIQNIPHQTTPHHGETIL